MPGMDVTVRSARKEDLEHLVDLRRENGRWHAGLDPVRHHVPEPDRVRAHFLGVLEGRVAGLHLLVAEVGGAVAGLCEFVMSGPPADHQIGRDRRTAQVHTVIRPEHRGAGVGRALVAAAENLAEQLEIDELIAPVLLANAPAAEFYADQGFAIYGQLLAKQLHGTPQL